MALASCALGEDGITSSDGAANATSTSLTENESTLDATYGSKQIESFDVAWETIETHFYDPEFEGVDWLGLREHYRPLALQAVDHDGFLGVVNAMLFELGVSHVGVVPADETEQVDPILTADGWAGVDIRLLGDECVITEVAPGSPADLAGLKPGYVVESVSGQSISQITDDAYPLPPLHERGRRSTLTNQIRQHLYGQAGTEITITYLDNHGNLEEKALSFVGRDPAYEVMPGLPPIYSELEVARLEDGYGYISFNAFSHNLVEPIIEAIGQMDDAPGLVVDLRGNHGGVFDVRKAIIDQLVEERDLIWTYKARYHSREILATPADTPYTGPLVVIVDVLSASSAEEFSGGLQAMGRAAIVGERTAGRVLVMETIQLPNGDLMLYPYAQTLVSDGTVLESHGVIPDLPIELNRDDLLAGVDTALQSAIEYLNSHS